jgi:hypothetical protein
MPIRLKAPDVRKYVTPELWPQSRRFHGLNGDVGIDDSIKIRNVHSFCPPDFLRIAHNQAWRGAWFSVSFAPARRTKQAASSRGS